MPTPLEPWIARKIGLPSGSSLTAAALEDCQLRRLRATVEYARDHAQFYAGHLAGVRAEDLQSPDDLSRIPFTEPQHLVADDRSFLCVSPAEIERIVTIHTSGTTGPAKRLHFTAEDLELTADFFDHGMRTLLAPGGRVLVLMPGPQRGSVGDQLTRGVARFGAEAVVFGIVTDRAEAIDAIIEGAIDCIVGLPVQVLGLARDPAAARIPAGTIKSVLLSADNVPRAVVQGIEDAWGVPVFDHYGMTEMGLGGAVECAARAGMHIREADLLLEIIDPHTGRRLPDGEIGEIAFTTLTRAGMPLVRYRTGDLSRMLAGPCPCGSFLRRLDRIAGRISGYHRLPGGSSIGIADLDEALFAVPGVLDFEASLERAARTTSLAVTVLSQAAEPGALAGACESALRRVPALRGALAAGGFALHRVAVTSHPWPRSGSIKRTLNDRREAASC